MLKHTFCHIPRVGVKTEARLWECGITHWDFLGDAGDAPIPGLQRSVALASIEESRQRLAQRDAAWFAGWLPSSEIWRLYSAFRNQTAYLDIETTGAGPPEDHVTTIALYDGREVRTYVFGRNLEDFLDDVRQYRLLVTFNGRCFDVPFLERQFRIRFDHAHLDLRFALKAAGVSGGLKKVERLFGLHRGDLDGVDGYHAVLLWREFQNTGDERYLETLLAYNVEDVLSLEVLAAKAYNLLLEATPFGPSLALPVPDIAPNPVRAYPETLERINRAYFRSFRR